MPEFGANNVVAFSSHPEVKERGLLGRVEAYQRLARDWSAHLDAQEQVVLLQIIDRSAGWGRGECKVTSQALREGSGANSGVARAVSRGRLFECLSSLEARGLILRRSTGRTTIISVNLSWVPPVIALPKRLRDGPPAGQQKSVSRTTPVRLADTYTDTPDDTLPTSISAPHPLAGPAGVRDLAARVAQTNAALRSTKASKAMTKKGARSVEVVWRTALVETFPGVAHQTWNPAFLGMAKNACNSWPHSNVIAFLPFLDWAVRNWPQIIAKQFKWMTASKPPATPAFNFFIHFIGQFAECYTEKKLGEWLDAKERTDLDRRMARGQDREEALAEIGAERAAVRMRREMGEKTDEANRTLRRAKAAEERAEKISNAGAAPVHPRATTRSRPAAPMPDAVDIKVNVPFVPKENPFD